LDRDHLVYNFFLKYKLDTGYLVKIYCRHQLNHQINYSNHQYHLQIVNKYLKFLIFHLFEALI